MLSVVVPIVIQLDSWHARPNPVILGRNYVGGSSRELERNYTKSNCSASVCQTFAAMGSSSIDIKVVMNKANEDHRNLIKLIQIELRTAWE